MRLANKKVMVVGAGQTSGETIGNGRAISVLFAREGARLHLVDRDPASLVETATMVGKEGQEATTFVADVRHEDACKAAVEACVDGLGGVDVLVNVVGIGAGDASVTRIEEEAWDLMMDVNMKSVLFMSKYALPHMREAGGGNILSISSVAAIASAGYVGYKVSKAGVNALTHTMATTNARYGIRANAIMPGLMDTPMAIEGIANARGIGREQLRDERNRMVPLGKQMGTAWDTAYAALFLASDEAKFITGVVLPVDGGQIARIG